MSGSLGDMGSLLKQAQQMQRELDRVREELKTAVVEGTSGGGAVRVRVTGDKNVQEVRIAPEVVQGGDVEALEDMVLAALNDGLRKADDLANEARARITGGIDLPGIF